MITISLNITLEATDLATLSQQLLGQYVATLLEAPAVTEPIQPQRHEERKESPPRLRGETKPPKRPARIVPTAPNGLEATRTDVREENIPADGVTHEIAAIPPATKEAEAKPKRNTQPRPQLSFAEFDTLVGKELKRLSVDGRIPNASLWDEHRDQRLPTYGAVMQRYGCTNLASFAEKMGMQPPLSKAFTINHNGAAAIYSKESETAHAATA